MATSLAIAGTTWKRLMPFGREQWESTTLGYYRDATEAEMAAHILTLSIWIVMMPAINETSRDAWSGPAIWLRRGPRAMPP